MMILEIFIIFRFDVAPLQHGNPIMAVLKVNSDLTLTGDLGFEQKRLQIQADGLVVDFSDSLLHSNVYPAIQNPYPFMIELEGHSDILVQGGTIIRHDNPNTTWKQSYKTNSSGFVVYDSEGSVTVDGLRLHNTHDGIRVGRGNYEVTVRHVYATHIRDDMIENDSFNTMTIEDSLFDGVFVGFSAVNTGSKAPANPDAVVTIRDTILRLEAMAGDPGNGGQPGHGKLFKWYDKRAPDLVLENNIFVVEDADFGPFPNNIVHAENNVLIWMGKGSFTHALPEGFTLIVGDDSVFREARDAWLVRHGYDPTGSLEDNLHAPDLDGVQPPSEPGNELPPSEPGNELPPSEPGNELPANTVTGTDAGDRLSGSSGDDFIRGHAGSDVVLGGDGNDVIHGDAGNDKLAGNDGDDRIYGGAGDDVLYGGPGSDILTGGTGADRFWFKGLKQSKPGDNRDVILDFDNNDVIDVAQIDADSTRSANQAFRFIGREAFSGRPGELRLEGDILQGNVDRDVHPDFEVQIVGITSLVSDDFWL